MPIEDARRWNLRYADVSKKSFELPRPLLIDKSELLPRTGLALDIAMGLGGNAKFLIEHGFRVIGVDISSIAIGKAARIYPRLMPVIADMEYFFIPQLKFDVILDFYYLQRNLWLPMVLGLKIGGILFVECLTDAMLSIHPDIDPSFLLKSGELEREFLGEEYRKYVEILYAREGWHSEFDSHPRAIASLVVRRIG